MKNLQFEDGKMIPASKYFSSGESSSVELSEEELKIAAEIKARLHGGRRVPKLLCDTRCVLFYPRTSGKVS